ncbi:PP2C family protein-serine/threonine phosphatase [Vallicoccus soli]|uniref:Serine/threonine-protein phosphatase n=1 Tax=Vallicoccus soli TaxID=2339232 RepID=A0A3A3Z5W2_9ACTN|nr:PP2C family protein-serine/threonine phosphatase [Vallicoccus soli]RJK97098.1 serine/threonine-protein phosphatase [Vallicoccus soli]
MASSATGARRGARRAGRRLARAWRRVLHGQGPALLATTALSVLLALAAVQQPDWVPLSVLVLPIILGGFLLSTRGLVLLYVAVAALTLLVAVERAAEDLPSVPRGVPVVLGGTALLVLVLNRSRRALGVLGSRGDAMLVDLRARLRAHGEVPDLPPGWAADTAQRSAHGESFSGDFVVACRSGGGGSQVALHRADPDGLLELVLVDVSGKGVDAGTRSLLLSGAFGGLLGAVPPEGFLGAANAYLLRQDWPEGFATAVHVALDLGSGAYRVSSAGHPPAARFDAGSGRWCTLEASGGPLLGIIPEPGFPSEAGHLDHGDALLLYTDGLVEEPGRDLAEGIDRLLGRADRLVAAGWAGGAERLLQSVPTGQDDDRALVLLRRA